MPKHFDESDKQYIYQRLIEESQTHWARYGVKRTSVADLCKAVGIAKGSFYNFFESKEDLFMTVLEVTDHKIKKQLMAVVARGGDNRKQNFIDALYASFIETKRYPWIVKLQSSGQEYQYFLSKLSMERIRQHAFNDEKDVAQLLALWQISTDNIDVKLVTAMLRATYLMLFHEVEIGEDHLPKVIKLQLEGLANYLFGGDK